jgi:hypothetical protein
MWAIVPGPTRDTVVLPRGLGQGRAAHNVVSSIVGSLVMGPALRVLRDIRAPTAPLAAHAPAPVVGQLRQTASVRTSQETLTDRLVLSPPRPSDLDELHRLHADPAVWEHLPAGRHTSPDQTAALMERYATGWREHGLDVWVTGKPSDDGAGALVGIGGCSLRHGLAWNPQPQHRSRPPGRGRTMSLSGPFAVGSEGAAGQGEARQGAR